MASIQFDQNDRNLLDALQSSEFGEDEVYFIRNLKSYVLKMYDHVGNLSQHTKKELNISKIDILNSNISVDNATSKIKATSIHATNIMPIGGLASLNLNGNIISNREIRTSAILPLSGADSLSIGGIQIGTSTTNASININTINPVNANGVNIDGINIKTGSITAKSIVSDVQNGLQSVNINGSVMSTGGASQLKSIRGISTNSVQIEKSVFTDSTANIQTLQTSTIQSQQGGNIKFNNMVEGLRLAAGSSLDVPNLNTNVIEPLDGTDLKLSGKIVFDNAEFFTATSGVTIGGVHFEGGNLYVNNVYKSQEVTNGITFEDVNLQNGIVSCKQIDIKDPDNPSNAGSLNVSNLTLRNIYEENTGQGISLNGVKIQDKYLMLPARDITDDANMKYAKLFYTHEQGKLFIETSHGNIMTPPDVVNWQDWVPYNTDMHVQLKVEHTRFTVIDQSVWVSVDIEFVVQNTVPADTKELWITLPPNYSCVEVGFSSFSSIRNMNDGRMSFGQAIIDGTRNRNVIYFVSEQSFTQASYRVTTNMVYEYEPIDTLSTNPWQSWYPTIKDKFIRTISIQNSRYYKIGTNMWTSFDLTLAFYNPPSNLVFPQNKTTTYISLPPGANAKNVTFSNAIMIVNKQTGESFNGIVTVGTNPNDAVLDTTNMKFETTDTFESGFEYFIKGQIVFEETSISPLDFFFDEINWNLRNSNDFKSFTITNNESNSNKFEIFTSFDSDVMTSGEWSNFISHDSNIIRFMSSNGLDRYLQIMIIPFIQKSRSKTPWRILQINNNVHFQITTDGHRYVDQFVLERDYISEVQE